MTFWKDLNKYVLCERRCAKKAILCQGLHSAVMFSTGSQDVGHCIMLSSLTLTSCMFPCKVWWEDVFSECGSSQPHKSLHRFYSFFPFSLPLSPKCNFSRATESHMSITTETCLFIGSMSQMFSGSIFFPFFGLRETHQEPLRLYEEYIFMSHLMFPACHVIARVPEAVGCRGSCWSRILLQL